MSHELHLNTATIKKLLKKKSTKYFYQQAQMGQQLFFAISETNPIM